MECIICLDRPGYSAILGCEHMYCEECIARWCTDHTAHCPTCQLPVHGLIRQTVADDVVYLSPHETTSWGMTVAPRVPGVFQLQAVRSASISEANGLREKQLIRVFGSGGQPIASIDEFRDFAAEVHSKKRLLKVQKISDLPEEPERPASLWRCCLGLRHAFVGGRPSGEVAVR